MLILIAPTIWIFCGSLALWARSQPRGANILLGGALLSGVQMLSIVLALGWLGHLRREPILGLTVLVNVVLVCSNPRGLGLLLRHLLSDIHTSLADLKQSKAATTILVISLGAWIWIFGLGVLLPPTDFDGLAQNIPIAAFHLQEGNLARIETPYRGIHAYPANGALWIAWSMLVAGEDSLIDLVQLPFWLLGALAVYHLARLAAATRKNAMLGSAIFIFAPVVILQARAAYFDLMLASMVLAALALIADRQLSIRYAAAAVGSALGVILGLKYAGAINAIPLGLLLLLRIYLERRALSRAALVDLAVAALPALILGGYWYLGNWHDLGNPFWPMTVQLGGLRLFDGVWTVNAFYENTEPGGLIGLPYPLLLWNIWREPTSFYGPDMRLGGLGPLWFAIGLPCAVFYLAQSLRHRDRMGLMTLGFAGVVFVLTPANWHTRYVIAPMALSGVAVAVLLGQMGRWLSITLSVLIVVHSIYSAGVALACGPVTAADVARFARLPAPERLAIFADNAAAVQPALRWFDRNVPETTTIAYGWGGVIFYPFWKGAPTRKVIYVPPTDPPFWFDALRRHNAEFLITRQGSREANAAAREPRFRTIYLDSTYAIYALH